MTAIVALSEAELRTLVPLDRDTVTCIEEAFAATATKTVAQPPGLELDVTDRQGLALVKSAYVPGDDGFAVKVVSAYFGNPKIGLPSVNGLMIVFRADNGLIDTLLLDNGYLTNIRTAAAGAVAAKYLSRPDCETAAILGAGTQGHLQLEALTLVRPIKQARIWAPTADERTRTAAELSDRLGISVTAAADAAEAVDGTDIIVTATPAQEPILQAEWIAPGQHITAMGADAAVKNEIAPAIIAPSLSVADSLAQTREVGELHHALAAGLVDDGADFAELGAVIAGQKPGRQSADHVTLADLTGVGVQDTAIAALAVARGRQAGAGTKLG